MKTTQSAPNLTLGSYPAPGDSGQPEAEIQIPGAILRDHIQSHKYLSKDASQAVQLRTNVSLCSALSRL